MWWNPFLPSSHPSPAEFGLVWFGLLISLWNFWGVDEFDGLGFLTENTFFKRKC